MHASRFPEPPLRWGQNSGLLKACANLGDELADHGVQSLEQRLMDYIESAETEGKAARAADFLLVDLYRLKLLEGAKGREAGALVELFGSWAPSRESGRY